MNAKIAVALLDASRVLGSPLVVGLVAERKDRFLGLGIRSKIAKVTLNSNHFGVFVATPSNCALNGGLCRDIRRVLPWVIVLVELEGAVLPGRHLI